MTGQGRCSGGGRLPTPASSDSDNSIVAKEESAPQLETAGGAGTTGYVPTDGQQTTGQSDLRQNPARHRVRLRADGGGDCIKRMRKEKQKQRGGNSSDDDDDRNAVRCSSGAGSKGNNDDNNLSKAKRQGRPASMSGSAASGKELSDAVRWCRVTHCLSVSLCGALCVCVCGPCVARLRSVCDG